MLFSLDRVTRGSPTRRGHPQESHHHSSHSASDAEMSMACIPEDTQAYPEYIIYYDKPAVLALF